MFEVADAEREAVAAVVREEMAAALPLGEVPVEVELGFGPNWLDAH